MRGEPERTQPQRKQPPSSSTRGGEQLTATASGSGSNLKRFRSWNGFHERKRFFWKPNFVERPGGAVHRHRICFAGSEILCQQICLDLKFRKTRKLLLPPMLSNPASCMFAESQAHKLLDMASATLDVDADFLR